MSAIKIQGEVYESAEELRATIEELETKLEELPESSQGRADLAAHIERLKTAAEEGKSSEPSPADDERDPDDDGQTAPDPASLSLEIEPPLGDEEEEEPLPDEKPCPVCGGRGFFPLALPVDPHSEACPTCYGFGQVVTGSKVPGHTEKDCPDCQGQGYINRRAPITSSGDAHVAPAPGLPGSIWNADEQHWDPPEGSSPPWSEASWDHAKGVWA